MFFSDGSCRELAQRQLSDSSWNTEVKGILEWMKIVHAYIRMLVAQIRKLSVSTKRMAVIE